MSKRNLFGHGRSDNLLLSDGIDSSSDRDTPPKKVSLNNRLAVSAGTTRNAGRCANTVPASQQSWEPEEPWDEIDSVSEDDVDEGQGWSPDILKSRFEAPPIAPDARYQRSVDTPYTPDIGEVLHNWLEQVCCRTGTTSVYEYLPSGVAAAVQGLQNVQVCWEIKNEPSFSIKYMCASIWLSACLRFHCKVLDLTISGVDKCRVLLHSISSIIRSERHEDDSGISGEYDEAFNVKHDANIEGCIRWWENRLQSCDRYCQWFSTLPRHVELLAKEPRNRRERGLMHILSHDGIVALAEEILRMEAKSRTSPFTSAQQEGGENYTPWLLDELVKLLVSASYDLLEALVHGDVLAKSMRARFPLHDHLAIVQARGDTIPAIYGNFLADGAGMGPTGAHMRQIAADVKKYCSCWPDQSPEEQQIEEIDTIWRPVNRVREPQDRRYSSTKANARSHAREENMKEWARLREKSARFSIRANKALVPSAAPECNIGYSRKALSRLENHAKHASSNYIMNLVEAICLRRYGPGLRIQQLILLSLWDPVHPWLGEIAITNLSQAYMKDHGFCHTQAGLSNYSMYRNFSEEDTAGFERGLNETGKNLIAMLDEEAENQDLRNFHAVEASDTHRQVLARTERGISSLVDAMVSLGLR